MQTVFAVAVIAASLIVWSAAFARLWHGLPILPYEPRRSVPWTAADLALPILVYVLFAMIVQGVLFTLDPVLFNPTSRALDTAIQSVNQPAQSEPLAFERLKITLVFDILLKLFICAGAMVWILLRRGASLRDLGLSRGKMAADVVLGLMAFMALMLPVYLIQLLMTRLTPSKHPLTTALAENPDWGMFVLAVVAAVGTAPVVEEIGFRLLLQGWLESLVSYWRRLRASADAPDDESPTNDLIEGTTASGVDGPQALGAASPYAPDEPNPNVSPSVDRNGETSEEASQDDDAGLQRTAWAPIFISSIAFALMHFYNGPDVVALFVLALGLGYVYQRTHRILPCIVVHFCLNATSLWLLWMSIGR